MIPISERHDTQILSSSQETTSKCSCGKVALIISVATFIFSVVLANLFRGGGLVCIVSWSIAGGSAFFIVGFAIKSCVTRKKEEDVLSMGVITEEEECKNPINTSALNEALPPVGKRRLALMKSALPKTRQDLANYYQNDLFTKTPFTLMPTQYTASTTELSKKNPNSRISFQILESLIDPLFLFCGMEIMEGTNFNQKVEQLLFTFKQSRNEKYKFLIEKDNYSNDLQNKLYLLFQELRKIENPDADYVQLKENFLDLMQQCIISEFYQQNIHQFLSSNREVAREKFPEIVLLQIFGFEMVSQISLNHFLFEMSCGRKKVSSNLEDNFSFVLWEGSFGGKKSTLNTQFLHFGTAISNHFKRENVQALLNLFFDYCVRENFKSLFFHSIDNITIPQTELVSTINFGTSDDFFNQTGSYGSKKWVWKEFYPHLISAINFTTNLITQQDIEQIARYVHDSFFNKSTSLDLSQRRIFVTIVHALLLERVSIGFGSNFFFFHGTKERDMTLMGTLFALSLVRKPREVDVYEKQKADVLSGFATLVDHSIKENSRLNETLSFIFSLSKKDIDKIRTHANLLNFPTIDVSIIDKPNQTLEKPPCETGTIEEYHKRLKDDIRVKRVFSFPLPNFVDTVLAEAKLNQVDLLKQSDRDFHGIAYLIDHEKISLSKFKKELRNKKWNDTATQNKFDKLPFNQIINFEKNSSGPKQFFQKLNEIRGMEPLFTEYIKECYFSLRAQAIRRFLKQKLSLKDEQIDKVFALSQQGVVQSLNSILKQTYSFSPKRPDNLSETGIADPREEEYLNNKINLFERQTSEFFNTCFNYVVKDRRLKIELYQIFEIVQGEVTRKTHYYIFASMAINCATGHATGHCRTLSADEKLGDITEMVKESKKKK